MSEKDVKIRISADASGVRPGTQEAGRHIEDLTGKVNVLPDAYNKATAATEAFANKGAALASALGLVGVGVIGVGAAALAYAAHAAMAGISTAKLANEMAALSDRTGLTVEHLSSMRFVLEQNNATVNDYAGGMKILSSRVYDAANGNKAALATFQALGVSQQFLRDNINNGDVVFARLADRFSEMKDGAGKNALANDVLGVSYQALLPTLNSGADGIRKLSEEGEKWGHISTDMAEKSRQLGDNWSALKFYAQGVGVDVANYFLPALVDITREARAAANESGLLAGAITALGVAFGKVFGLKSTRMEFAEDRAKDLFRQVSEAQAALDKLASLEGKSTGKDPDWLAGEMDKAAARVANLKNELKATITARDKLLSKPVDAPRTDAPYKPQKSSAGTGIDQYQKQLTSLLDTLENRADTVSKKFWQDLAMLDKAYQSGGLSLDRYRAAVEALIGKTEYAKNLKKEDAVALKLQEEGVKRLAAEEKKRNEELLKSVEIDQAALDAMTRKNDLLELGIESVSAMAVAELEAKLASLDYSDATYEVVDALEKRLAIAKQIEEQSRRGEHIKAMKDEANEADKAYEKMNDDINRGLTDALMRGFESGKGFAENLRDTVVNMFETMVLRPVISAVLSPVSGAISAGMGAMGLSGSASASSYAGMANNAYSLYNAATLPGGAALGAGLYSAGNVLGSAGMMGYGAGIEAASLGAIGGGGASVVGASGAVGSEAFAAGAAGASSGIGAALAAVPVWGWAALGALAIFGMSDSGGAPKVNVNTLFTGGADGIDQLKSEGGGEALSSAIYNDAVSAIVDKYASGTEYTSYLGGHINVQGNSSNQNFAYVNTLGRALNSVNETGDGVIYNNQNPSFGKGTEDWQAWAEKEIPRMQLAIVTDALRTAGGEVRTIADMTMGTASDLTDTINMLDDAGVTEKLNQMMDGLTIISYIDAQPIEDYAAAAEQANRTLMDVWRDSGDALNDLIATYDGSAAATHTLAAATQSQYQLELQLIGQIQSALASTQGMFGNSIESIKLSVMDEGAKYDYYRAQADTIYQQLETATDPAQIQGLAEQINQYTNQAYGLLDAEQQQGAASGFIDYLTQVDELTTQRLNEQQDQIVADHDAISAAITSSMDAAAARMADAVAAAVTAAANNVQPNPPVSVTVLPGFELGYGT